MDNKGFGEVDVLVVLILLLILADALRDEIVALVSFLLSEIQNGCL